MTVKPLRWLVLFGLLVGLFVLASIASRHLPPDETASVDTDQELLRQLGYVDWHSADNPDRKGVTLHRADRVSPGYNLYTNLVDEVRLEDLDGRLVHSWSLPGKLDCEHAEFLPGGRLAVVCVNDGLFVLDWDSSIRWQFRSPVHHDVAPLASDAYIVPVRGAKHFYRGRSVEFDDLVEVAADGTIRRRWSSFAALPGLQAFLPPNDLDVWPDFSEWLQMGLALIRNDHVEELEYFHINAIEILPDTPLGERDRRFRAGNWLVSLRNANTLVILDQEDLAVVWHWGRGVLEMQHTPTLTEDGHILVFDNGTHRGFSRVVELDPETGELAWMHQSDPPEAFLSKWQGSSQRLPNGNTLVCLSTTGHVVEITPAGEIVWEFWNRDIVDGDRRGIYRMRRLSPGFVEDILARHKAEPLAPQ